MVASIPSNEMAETLRVLAGGNASNAARHFTMLSYEQGNVAAATRWLSIVHALSEGAGAEPEDAAEPDAAASSEAADSVSSDAASSDAAAPIDEAESLAMQGVRYEDVDAETIEAEARLVSIMSRHRASIGTRRPLPEIDLAHAA